MNVVNNSFFDSGFTSENQQVFLPILKEKKIELFIKREDLIHPLVSGNKFRKLKYNFKEAKKLKRKAILTFGGAFSNHIVATAVAANLNQFNSIGIIRGDELSANLEKTLKSNSTLAEAHKNGMVLEFVSREDYRNKTSENFINQLKEKYSNFYLISEGGTNKLAIKGCEEILIEQDLKFNYICCAVGTGGTISGLINSAKNNQKIIGFPALKGEFIKHEVEKLTKKRGNWSLENYHFGGYAKYNEKLIAFINQFTKETKILLDPIYTGKMMFGIIDLVKKNAIPKGSKILAIHTGGIQGIEGFNNKLRKSNKKTIIIL